MFGFNVGQQRRDLLMAFDGPKTLLSIKQHTGQPALSHVRVAVALDIFLTHPHAREQAFDRIGRVERLAQERRHFEPVQRQQFMKSF